MYRCEDCGELFETPYEYEEPDVGYKAEWCPYCHCDAIEEVKKCKFCGEYHSYLNIDGFCESCVKNTRRKFNLWLHNKFEFEELQILKHEFDIGPVE